MQPIPYLFFKGDAREALAAYVAIFGSPPSEIMDAAAMPPGEMEVAEDRRDWVMHGAVRVGEGWIYASDDMDATGDAMAGCNVYVDLPTAAEGKRVFDELATGGEVRMPYAPTFWSPGFGALTDRWGIRWMISTTEAS